MTVHLDNSLVAPAAAPAPAVGATVRTVGTREVFSLASAAPVRPSASSAAATASSPAGAGAGAIASTAAATAAGALVSISAQGRQSLGPSGTAAMELLPSSLASALARWPSSGVGRPLQRLVQTLVQQATGGGAGAAHRVLAAQHWPAALVRVVDPESATDAEHGLEPLHTLLERQGVVQTPDGPRGVTVNLRVPLAWMRALAQADATQSGDGWIRGGGGRSAPAPTPTLTASGDARPRPLQLAFSGPSASLQSGALALALESPALAGGRTSALMLLEFQPLLRSAASTQAQALYGHHIAPHLRQDPWLQITSLQVSGHLRYEEDSPHHASAALCDTPGCPYQGETACVQPFCMVLRAPAPVEALAHSSGLHSAHEQGIR